MILTINAIRDAGERQRFDQVVLPRLRTVAPADFAVAPEYQRPVTTAERVRAFADPTAT